MGRACSMYGRDEKCIQKFWLENVKERDHLEELGTHGRTISE
jgi:hypothetical protein